VGGNVVSDQVRGCETVAQSSLAASICNSDGVFAGAEVAILPSSGSIHRAFDGQFKEPLRQSGLRLARDKGMVTIEPTNV